MSVVDKAFSVYNLAKKGLTIEVQEEAMQLRREALELEEENLRLRKENRELRERVDLQETVTFRRKVYWRDGDTEPFCPYCYEKSGLLIHLSLLGDVDGELIHVCPHCADQYREIHDGDYVMYKYFRKTPT